MSGERECAHKTCDVCAGRGQIPSGFVTIPCARCCGHGFYTVRADIEAYASAFPQIAEKDARIAELEGERDALRHSESLIQADLGMFKTDCSTPTFELARYAVKRIAELEELTRSEYARGWNDAAATSRITPGPVPLLNLSALSPQEDSE